jgi:hypothetical protein
MTAVGCLASPWQGLTRPTWRVAGHRPAVCQQTLPAMIPRGAISHRRRAIQSPFKRSI